MRPIACLVFAACALCAAGASAATTPEKPATDSTNPPRKSGLFSTGSNVSDIAVHVVEIEKRLEGIEQSVKGVKGLEASVGNIDRSLAQVAAVVRAESLRELENDAGDIALARGALLILLATACGAALLVLHAWLRRRHRESEKQ